MIQQDFVCGRIPALHFRVKEVLLSTSSIELSLTYGFELSAVGVLIPPNFDYGPLLRWAARFARARKSGIVLLRIGRRSGNKGTKAISLADDQQRADEQRLVDNLRPLEELGFRWHSARLHSDSLVKPNSETNEHGEETLVEVLPISGVSISTEGATQHVLSQLDEQDVQLLILPRPTGIKASEERYSLQRTLLKEATCEAMQLCIRGNKSATCDSVLVPAGGGEMSRTAMLLANDLAETCDGQLTALYVEPNIDEFALQAGQKIIRRNVERTLGSENQNVSSHVVLNDDVARGIAAVQDEFDLVLLGERYRGQVHHLLFSSISEQLLSSDEGAATAVIRQSIPLTNRVGRMCQRWISSTVPQLERQQRVDLVTRVQSSSNWDFDFIALICLSTLIAGLGLIQNSVAVVIGAMLVAPLMTPLLGMGLSLTQGNYVLFRNAGGAVLRGFCLAFAIGLFLGLCMRLFPGWNAMLANGELPSEIAGRGSPGITDLLIAFVSGVAAAYANGRPNLVSALPGVAIAAALVPPIASSGIAAAAGHAAIAFGATLLFLTNIVAIALGTACAFWAVGVRGAHQHGKFQSWAVRVAILLAIVAILLGVFEAWQPGWLGN